MLPKPRRPFTGKGPPEPDYQSLSFEHLAKAGELATEVASLRECLVELTSLPFTESGRWILEAQEEITRHTTDPYYDALYRSEELLYWLKIPEWIHQWASASRPEKMVDIGPGYGTISVFCARLGAAVGTLDIHSYRLAHEVLDKYGISAVTGNVEFDQLPWEEVDGVVMTEVFEHLNFHPVPTMSKICQAMRPDGRLFLSTPDAASWGRVEDSYQSYHDMPAVDPDFETKDQHIYQYFDYELVEVLEAAGFRILRLERSPGRWGFHLNVEAERPSSDG